MASCLELYCAFNWIISVSCFLLLPGTRDRNWTDRQRNHESRLDGAFGSTERQMEFWITQDGNREQVARDTSEPLSAADIWTWLRSYLFVSFQLQVPTPLIGGEQHTKDALSLSLKNPIKQRPAISTYLQRLAMMTFNCQFNPPLPLPGAQRKKRVSRGFCKIGKTHPDGIVRWGWQEVIIHIALKCRNGDGAIIKRWTGRQCGVVTDSITVGDTQRNLWREGRVRHLLTLNSSPAISCYRTH